MKLTKNRKGFTIVELVIVIGVIGILSGILVPVFSNITSKASNAKDEALIKNLNTTLKIAEVDEGNNYTLHDAIIDLERSGITINNLRNLSNDNDLLWNSKTNQFLLESNISKEANKDYKYQFWKIQDEIETNQEYSIYASDDFTDIDNVSVNVGFDVGNNTNIKVVKYIRNDVAQDISIRTNGGNLVVRAPQDTVRHFGTTDAAIISRDTHSYIEKGVSHAKIDPTFCYGNKFAQSADSRATTQTKRACLDVNPYLKEGTTISLLDNNYIFDCGRTVKDNETDLVNNRQTFNPLPRYSGENDFMNFNDSDYVTRENNYHGLAFAKSDSNVAISNLDQLYFEDLFYISYHEPGIDPFGDEVIDEMKSILRQYNAMFPNNVYVCTDSANYQVFHGYFREYTATLPGFYESTILENEFNKIKIYYAGGYAQIKHSLDVLAAHSEHFNYINNRSMVFVGDSITYGGNNMKLYYNYLDEDLEIDSYIAMSAIGSCVTDLSSYGDQRSPLIDNYQAIPEAEVIMIYLGTNDYGKESPLGTNSDTTKDSFYGCLDIIMKGLKARCKDSNIIFVTPSRRHKEYTSSIDSSYHFTSYTDPNGLGFTLEDYVNAIKFMANKYSLGIIDLFTEWDIDPSTSSKLSDGLHPNTNGHRDIENIMFDDLPALGVDYRREAAKTMQYGNKFADSGSANLTAKSKISSIKNFYLEAGSVITLKNTTDYQMGVAKTSNETSSNRIAWASNGWNDTVLTISTTGWYGLTFNNKSGSNFNLRTEAVTISDLVTIE